MSAQGFVNGLYYDPNEMAPSSVTAQDLMRTADLVRVGLAGSLRNYRLRTFDGHDRALEQVSYGGTQPAGYATAPGEAVNYVEIHDNQTLYDLNAFKLPLVTSGTERARVQILAAALTAFSQGIAYCHAGMALLRSKSMDRNSFNSGDWFNRLDWTANDRLGAAFSELLYFVNVDTETHVLQLPSGRGKRYVLHPVHRAAAAADRRAAEQTRYDAARGQFTLPARTAVVFVIEEGEPVVR